MMKFGPAGNGPTFYDEGNKHSWQAPSWLASKGLSAYEYSGGRGIKITKESAEKIGEETKRTGIALSVHAPYFISMSRGEEKYDLSSIDYIIQSATACSYMGGDRVIIHTGGLNGISREEALVNTKTLMVKVLAKLDEANLGHIILCPEVMGKINQQGNLEEIIDLCSISERLLPCVDFGHYNAREQGILKDYSDYEYIFNEIENGLGNERMRKFHIHFSRIEYTKGGEKMHHNYEDTQFEPNFPPLARLLYEKSCDSRVICESKDYMMEDSLTFKGIYEEMFQK